MTELATHFVEALRARRNHDAKIDGFRRCFARSRRWLIDGLHSLVECRQFRLGLPDGAIVPQPAHDSGKESHAAAGEQFRVGEGPQGYPEVRCVAGFMTLKTGGRHTYD